VDLRIAAAVAVVACELFFLFIRDFGTPVSGLVAR
jgi:hypothetical protein